MYSPYTSPIVRLYVGPERIPFDVHKDIICNKSTVLKPKFEATPPSTKKREISARLPHHDPNDISRLIEFLYEQKYVLPRQQSGGHYLSTEYRLGLESIAAIRQHARLYFVGKKLGVSELQEYSKTQIATLLQKHVKIFELWENLLCIVRGVYQNSSPQKDELRELLVAIFAKHWVAYRKSSLKNGVIDPESKLGLFMQDFPAFKDDLLLCLGDGPGIQGQGGLSAGGGLTIAEGVAKRRRVW